VSDVETIEQIRHIAFRVRRAIQRIPFDERPCGMERFPIGACLDAALVLGACFANRHVEGFQLVTGRIWSERHADWCTHAWLLRGDLIVDITADQFDPKLGSVIVSERSEWHRLFETNPPSDSDFRNSGEPGNYDRTQVLMRIEAHLTESLDVKENARWPLR
jgi:hypothetical protein